MLVNVDNDLLDCLVEVDQDCRAPMIDREVCANGKKSFLWTGALPAMTDNLWPGCHWQGEDKVLVILAGSYQ